MIKTFSAVLTFIGLVDATSLNAKTSSIGMGPMFSNVPQVRVTDRYTDPQCTQKAGKLQVDEGEAFYLRVLNDFGSSPAESYIRDRSG